MMRTMMVFATLGLILGSPLGAAANDEPDSLMPCAYITIRPGQVSGVGARLRLSCPTPAVTPYDLPDEPANDPSIEGATLRVFDLGGNAGDDTYSLPAGPSWHRIPNNPMSPLRGWRYRATPTPTLPCKVVIVKERVVKAVCKNQAVTLTPPFSGEAAIVLTVGTDSKRYCGQLGGTELFNMTKLWRRNAPPPTACSSPSGAFLEMGAALIE